MLGLHCNCFRVSLFPFHWTGNSWANRQVLSPLHNLEYIVCKWQKPSMNGPLFFFFFLAVMCGMRDLSSLTRDWTQDPALELQSLNQWTTREVPQANRSLKNSDFDFRQTCIQNLILSLTIKVNSGYLINHPEPQFPHLQNGDNSYLKGVLKIAPGIW